MARFGRSRPPKPHVIRALATVTYNATGSIVGTFALSGTGTVVLNATGSIVGTFALSGTPLPAILLAPTVTAVPGVDPVSGDPIITVTLVADITGTRGAFTLAATVLRGDGNYVLGASPLFPLTVSSTNPTVAIVDSDAPYGVETTYIATVIVTESSAGVQWSPPSTPRAPVLMGQAPATDELYGRLGWAADQDETGVLEQWLAGIGQMMQTVDSLCRDGYDENGNVAPGWSQVLDIQRAPTYVLPWLAQFVGVRLDSTLRDDIQRYQIENPAGFARGTPGAIIAAVNQFLLPGYTATILERDTSPYHLAINVPTAGISGSSTCLSIAEQYTACSQLPGAFATCAAMWNTDANIANAITASIPAGLVAAVSYV